MNARIEIVIGRIEDLGVDAVVNAANPALIPGTGVDGALRAAAGPELSLATEKLAPIAPGEAVVTPGFRAPARFIVHTAAPRWLADGPEREKRALLKLCYQSCLSRARELGLADIAFPFLGAGNFGWPRELACAIAVDAVREGLGEGPYPARALFCCLTREDADLFAATLAKD